MKIAEEIIRLYRAGERAEAARFYALASDSGSDDDEADQLDELLEDALGIDVVVEFTIRSLRDCHRQARGVDIEQLSPEVRDAHARALVEMERDCAALGITLPVRAAS